MRNAPRYTPAALRAGWRWGALVAAAALAVFLIWFFFLRPTSASSTQAQPAQPPPRPALGKIIGYSGYTSAIDRALSNARQARSASGQDRRNVIQNAINELESVEGAGVSLQGDSSTNYAQVDNTAIINELGADNPNLNAVEQALSVLSRQLHAGAASYLPGTLDGSRAASQLRRILSAPAFDYEKDLSPLQRLVRWLSGLSGQADPGGTLWRWFIALAAALASGLLAFLVSERLNRWLRLGLSLVVGLLVGAAFYIGLNAVDITIKVLGLVGLAVAVIAAALIFSGVGRAAGPSSKPRTISELAAVLGMHAAEARRKAEEAASDRDYRSAIRYRCLALLLALDEAGKLTFDRAATNREYLFRAQGSLHDALQPLLTRFDEVWYGNRAASEQEWQDYSERAALIEATIQVLQRSAA